MNDGYTATYSTATGYSCLTSGPAMIGSILVHSSATGGFQLFTSSTATAASAITAPVSGSGYAKLFELNVNSPTGFCYRNLPAADPKLTIFWRPTGST